MTGLLADVTAIVPVAPGDQSWPRLLTTLTGFTGELLCVGTIPEPPEFATACRMLPGPCCARWLFSPRGRARQQNRGAAEASRQILWFLHADSLVTPLAMQTLDRAVSAQPRAVHFFDLRFAPDGPRLVVLNEWGARFRSRILKLPFGDQGLCLPRALFFQLGSFDESAAYGEDHLLVWAAHRARIPVLCTGVPLTTSARKYRDRGWLATTAQHVVLTLQQALGEWRKPRNQPPDGR